MLPDSARTSREPTWDDMDKDWTSTPAGLRFAAAFMAEIREYCTEERRVSEYEFAWGVAGGMGCRVAEVNAEGMPTAVVLERGMDFSEGEPFDPRRVFLYQDSFELNPQGELGWAKIRWQVRNARTGRTDVYEGPYGDPYTLDDSYGEQLIHYARVVLQPVGPAPATIDLPRHPDLAVTSGWLDAMKRSYGADPNFDLPLEDLLEAVATVNHGPPPPETPGPGQTPPAPPTPPFRPGGGDRPGPSAGR